MRIKKIRQSIGTKTIGIVDALTSVNPLDALSANQGRVLDEKKVDTDGVALKLYAMSSSDYNSKKNSLPNGSIVVVWD